jgi:F-actin monooxygenase
VIIRNLSDPVELLAPQNLNNDNLLKYAREAANYSTKYEMPNLEFAHNQNGQPDVAIFDFTSMFGAENSCRISVKQNHRLLACLVGDSLLQPFWPTGSGCARGFLSSMDAAFACKLFSNPRNSLLGVIAQRESIYRLLAQTTRENLQKNLAAYTLDPATRYTNLNKSTVSIQQIKHLLTSDDQSLYDQIFLDTNDLSMTPIRKRGRRSIGKF